MPALNFLKAIAPKVEDGSKWLTIRAKRKHPIQQGDPLYLYTGMRTQHCRKLLDDETATVVREIRITATAVQLDGVTLPAHFVEKLAQADGFDTVEEFRDYHRKTNGFPFTGQLIQWRDKGWW